jgi:hypothetical protein
VFRVVFENPRGGDSVERLVREFSLDEVILGRGGESQIVLQGRRIAPVHARLFWEGDSLVIVDCGSAAGTRVNGRRVARAILEDGALVALGDVTIRFETSGREVSLFCEIAEEIDLQEKAAQTLRALQIEAFLPRMRVVSLVFGVVALVWFGLYPFVSSDRTAWSSGPVSNAHSLIEADCQKCHANPFERVQDNACTACHSVSNHGESTEVIWKHHPETSKRCAECHMEHNGMQALSPSDARLCTECHAEMSRVHPDANVLDVASLLTHPEFRIGGRSSSGEITKISLGDVAAIDTGTVKLNHAVHLEGMLRTRTGEKKLSCNSCHELASDMKQMKPISFDNHCRECHALTFDDGEPEAEAPHGDAETVFSFLYAHYTKQDVGGAGISQTANHVDRVIPGHQETEHSIPRSPGERARRAERELFTKTGCVLCHKINERPAGEMKPGASHYLIQNANIPAAWFPGAAFSHGAHEAFSCQSCHAGVRESSETQDVLLPGVASCRDCHADGHKKGFVSSDCTQCHSYHDALPMAAEKKLEIHSFISSLIR